MAARKHYFEYQFDMVHSPGFSYIYKRSGPLGYGRAIILLGQLGIDNNAININDRPSALMLADLFDCDIDDLDKVLKPMLDSGCFESSKDGIISSKKIREVFDKFEAMSKKKKEAADARWENNAHARNTNADAQETNAQSKKSMQTDAPALKNDATVCTSIENQCTIMQTPPKTYTTMQNDAKDLDLDIDLNLNVNKEININLNQEKDPNEYRMETDEEYQARLRRMRERAAKYEADQAAKAKRPF